MSVLNDRAGVEVLQIYIGTAWRSKPLVCSGSFCNYSKPVYKL